MNLHQEYLRLHGIHRVLYEALPIVKASHELVALWAESGNGRDWEPRFEMPGGRSVFRARPDADFLRYLNDWRSWGVERFATKNYPRAAQFTREDVENWDARRRAICSKLRARPHCRAAWYSRAHGVICLNDGVDVSAVHGLQTGYHSDRDAIDRGMWLPRDFLVFGDELAPKPFEVDILRDQGCCDSCGKTSESDYYAWSSRRVAGLVYACCPKCSRCSDETFVANARAARLRPTHRPDTGLPRQVARFDTALGEVVFVDGVRQPPAPPKPSPADEQRAAKVKQHLAYLSTPTAELVKGLKP